MGTFVPNAAFEAGEFAGFDVEVQAMMDAVAIACEKLPPDLGSVAVRELRTLIEGVAETAEPEQRRQPKRKKKKRR
jgi:hypothetical protein